MFGTGSKYYEVRVNIFVITTKGLIVNTPKLGNLSFINPSLTRIKNQAVNIPYPFKFVYPTVARRKLESTKRIANDLLSATHEPSEIIRKYLLLECSPLFIDHLRDGLICAAI